MVTLQALASLPTRFTRTLKTSSPEVFGRVVSTSRSPSWSAVSLRASTRLPSCRSTTFHVLPGVTSSRSASTSKPRRSRSTLSSSRPWLHAVLRSTSSSAAVADWASTMVGTDRPTTAAAAPAMTGSFFMTVPLDLLD
jgi:hypothetical protein